MNFHHLLEQITHAYSGEAAWQVVADLSRCHRIQASPGYRRAAELVAQRLYQAGLDPETLVYPADEKTTWWAWPSFQEWSCTEAVLRLESPAAQAETLADFHACPVSVIQRSVPFEGEAEVVLVEDGSNDADYGALGDDLSGKLVLTRAGELRRVLEKAVKQRGALGILFDGMRPVMPVRPEGDLADARQYTSFWWEPGDRTCFGFVLTPRQGQALRRLLKDKQPVQVWAKVVSRLYDGQIEIVSAAIPGQDTSAKDTSAKDTSAKEVVVVAHLCHPQPSANDNASGAAAALEAARVLHKLVADGHLPAPQRTIRFLWLPEMTGSYAYLAGREAELDRLVAGINLDMVGEDQGQTGSSWLIESPPAAAASFAADLLARLRDELPTVKGAADVAPSHTGRGAYPLYRQAETPFSGGSDHMVFADPSVGIPMPMLIQWPDRFYHTSADTPDRTDPNSLLRAGSLAAAYAWWLAVAGPDEIAWLGHEMIARFKTRLVETTQQTVTDAAGLDQAEALVKALDGLDRQIAFQLDREKTALGTLERIGPLGCLIDALVDEATRAAYHELDWARQGIELHAAELGLGALFEVATQAPALSDAERRAAAVVPVRRMRGPVPLYHHLGKVSAADRQALTDLMNSRPGPPHHTLVELALYWADGTRSLLDIAHLVRLEAGSADAEVLLAYFKLLEQLGFVTL